MKHNTVARFATWTFANSIFSPSYGWMVVCGLEAQDGHKIAQSFRGFVGEHKSQ